MNRSRFLRSLALLAIVLAVVVAEELYSDKFDNVNIDEILQTDAIREQYLSCLMDTGPCDTDIQKFVKEHVAEAFVTKCRRCTEPQKKMFEKITSWYSTNRPDEWGTLGKKLMEDYKKKTNS